VKNGLLMHFLEIQGKHVIHNDNRSRCPPQCFTFGRPSAVGVSAIAT
jgi:hypothetical protein